MRKKRFFIPAVFILILSFAIPHWAGDMQLGSFNLPRNIIYQGKTIAKGSYNLALESKNGDAYLLIKKGDEVLCREMAIIIPAKRNYSEAKIAVAVLVRDDDPLLRIRAFVGNKTYSTYHEYMK